MSELERVPGLIGLGATHFHTAVLFAGSRYPDVMSVTKHLLISGHVQGVGFRFYMERKARELSITGWVRNRRDGSVEAVAHGSPDAVVAMIAWARRGPSGAVVSDIRITEDSGEYADFVTLPTE